MSLQRVNFFVFIVLDFQGFLTLSISILSTFYIHPSLGSDCANVSSYLILFFNFCFIFSTFLLLCAVIWYFSFNLFLSFLVPSSAVSNSLLISVSFIIFFFKFSEVLFNSFSNIYAHLKNIFLLLGYVSKSMYLLKHTKHTHFYISDNPGIWSLAYEALFVYMFRFSTIRSLFLYTLHDISQP